VDFTFSQIGLDENPNHQDNTAVTRTSNIVVNFGPPRGQNKKVIKNNNIAPPMIPTITKIMGSMATCGTSDFVLTLMLGVINDSNIHMGIFI
jgi:hypothetical protein